MDIEYDSDGYNDTQPTKRPEAQASKTGGKRRPVAIPTSPSKRRRAETGAEPSVSGKATSPTPTVLWRPRQARNRSLINGDSRSGVDGARPYALLKDWRERFGGSSGSRTSDGLDAEKVGGGDAILAGETEPEDPASNDPVTTQPLEDTSLEEDDEVRSLMVASGVDPEVLKAALRRGLAETGADVEGLDECMLLKYAARMLGETEPSEDIAGELAAQLLGGEDDVEQESGGEEAPANGFSQWVSRQAQAGASTRGDGRLSPVDSVTKSPSIDTASPPTKLPLGQRPPTPASTETTSSGTPSKFMGVYIPAKKRVTADVSPSGVPSSVFTETRFATLRSAASDSVDEADTLGPTTDDAAIATMKASQILRPKTRTSALKRKADDEAVDPTAAGEDNAGTDGQRRGRKRKAGAQDVSQPVAEPTSKRRLPSYAAPTTTSKAKAAPAAAETTRTTRSGKARRG